MPYSLPGQVVIDNTPNYFANHEKIPARIFNLNQGMKLVLVVRIPVDRAISKYAMHKMNFIIYKVVKYRKILLIYNVYFIFSLVKI